MQPMQTPLQLVQPLNDQQLVALMACYWPGLPASEAVSRATDILSEVILRCGKEADEVGRKVKEKNPTFLEARRAEMEMAQRQQNSRLVLPGGPIPNELLKRTRQ